MLCAVPTSCPAPEDVDRPRADLGGFTPIRTDSLGVCARSVCYPFWYPRAPRGEVIGRLACEAAGGAYLLTDASNERTMRSAKGTYSSRS